MCGIAGFCDFTKRSSLERLRQMTDMLYHRGPDDSGYQLVETESAQIGLGHRRLSIIDLSALGHQPMTDFHQRAWIIFNGEIYNHHELRKELEALGERFVSRTDTEVLLIAYLVWGAECVHRLNGMWSFVIWDIEKKLLFLSRDRSGKKPLYYAHNNGIFAFASQLKALRVFSELPWEINLKAFNAYLALGYVPGELAFFSPAQKLSPGHNAFFNLNTGNLQIHRYWSLPYFQSNSERINEHSAYFLDKLENLTQTAVALRLEADVPVGVLLSGGVDSSILAALATRVKGKGNVKTFTVKMPDSKLDESVNARKIAEYLGTEHYELPAPPSSLDLLPELVEYCDEPLADSSILPTFILSRLTKEHVTVALGGDGGDEIFGGYRHYPQVLEFQKKWGWIPASFWKTAGTMAGTILPVGLKGRNRLASFRKGLEKSWLLSTPYFDPWARQQLFKDDILETEDFFYPEDWGFWDKDRTKLSQMLALDFQSYLVDDILVKVDRASMGVALEVRAPWLDVNVIEYAFREIPDGWKVRNTERRRIQALLAHKLLPNILDTKRKQGFSIPLFTWFQDKEIQTTIREWIYDSPLNNYVKEKSVEKLLRGISAGQHNESRVFALCMAGLSMRYF